MIYFQDDKIIIREIKEADAPSLFTWDIDKELNQYDPRPVPRSNAELLQQCMDFCRRFNSEIMNPNIQAKIYKYFIVTDKEGNPIGFVNFFGINKEKKQGEMGVMIGDKRWWRNGIALKAVNIAVDYIFNNMDISRIYIETGECNIPSIRLFTKAGFAKCGEYLEEDGFKFIVMEKTS